MMKETPSLPDRDSGMTDTVGVQPTPKEPFAPRISPRIGTLGHDWMDDVVREQEGLGTFTDLPGKGKPLTLKPNFNIADHIMEQNHLLPPWLQLQREIYQAMKDAVVLLETGNVKETELRITAINVQIRRYNRSCPSPLLQRNPVSVETLGTACARWAAEQ